MSKSTPRAHESLPLGAVLGVFPAVLNFMSSHARGAAPPPGAAPDFPAPGREPKEDQLQTVQVVPARGKHKKSRDIAWRTFPAFGPKELAMSVKAGLPAQMVSVLVEVLGEPQGRIAKLSNIAQTTLHRRLESGVLRQDEGERVLRLFRVVEAAMRLFGEDNAAARNWLNTPLEIFDNASPLDFSDSEPGALFVEKVIGRLEHGVFS
jgi:putative toxin-antitoxin system antitoxin component (TIGR02293 family)